MRRRGLGSIAVTAIAAMAATAAACGASSPMSPSGHTLSVTAVSPSSVSTTGGAIVTISGMGFAPGATVSIDSVAAANVAVSGVTSITFVAPVHPAGLATLVVSSGGETTTGTISFVAPSGANAPPVISDIATIGTRVNQPSLFADLTETVQLTSTVTNVEGASGLTYAWSVGAGAVSGAGATVNWTLPASLGATPSSVAVSLTVTETFDEGGVQHHNVVSASARADVHDSQVEILEKGFRFLDRFSQSRYSVDDVLADFSTTCTDRSGRGHEADDVEKNRNLYEQLPGYSVTPLPPVAIAFGGQCPHGGLADACSAFSVHWITRFKVDIDGQDGDVRGPKDSIGDTIGTDYVSAELQNGQWKLCRSAFSGSLTITEPGGAVRAMHIGPPGLDGRIKLPGTR